MQERERQWPYGQIRILLWVQQELCWVQMASLLKTFKWWWYNSKQKKKKKSTKIRKILHEIIQERHILKAWDLIWPLVLRVVDINRTYSHPPIGPITQMGTLEWAGRRATFEINAAHNCNSIKSHADQWGKNLRCSDTIRLSEIHSVKDQRFVRCGLVFFNHPMLAPAAAVLTISNKGKFDRSC